MSEVLRIVSGERYSFDTSRVEQTYTEILDSSQANIVDNINLAKVTLCGHDWELLSEKEVIEIESQYLAVYKKVPTNRKFYFSFSERCKSIGLENNRLTATYQHDGTHALTQFRNVRWCCSTAA
jgi:hypothetical protein